MSLFFRRKHPFRFRVSDGHAVLIRYLGNDCSVTVPQEYNGLPVTAIGKNAFRGCRHLASVILPEGLQAVHSGAFSRCKSLSLLLFPSSLRFLGKNVFRGCSEKLSAVFLNPSLTIPEDALRRLHETYIASGDGLVLAAYGGHETEVSLPDSVFSRPVVGISEHVFALFGCLSVIRLPKGLKFIGDGCFSGCAGLTTVQFPDTLLEIGRNAFENSGISALLLPKSLSSVGDHAFFGCAKLMDLQFTGDFCHIGPGAFANCNLTRAILPDGLEEIQTGTFSGNRLLAGISLPSGLEAVWEFAFADSGLTDVSIPSRTQLIGEGAFSGCASLSSVFIGKSVRDIDPSAFSSAPALTEIRVHPENTVYVSDGLRLSARPKP